MRCSTTGNAANANPASRAGKINVMSALPLPAQQILQQRFVEAQAGIHRHIVNARLRALGRQVLSKVSQGRKIVAADPFRIDGELFRRLDVRKLYRALEWECRFGLIENVEENDVVTTMAQMIQAIQNRIRIGEQIGEDHD